jgi:hypothetical protein
MMDAGSQSREKCMDVHATRQELVQISHTPSAETILGTAGTSARATSIDSRMYFAQRGADSLARSIDFLK